MREHVPVHEVRVSPHPLPEKRKLRGDLPGRLLWTDPAPQTAHQEAAEREQAAAIGEGRNFRAGRYRRGIGKDQVQVTGGKGRPKTDTLKASIGYVDSYIGEGQISYGGPGAVARGKLALDIVAERLKLTGVKYDEIRYDLIGLNSLHKDKLSAGHDPYEVRVRVAGRTKNMKEAVRIGNEVETLYTNGPAGGAGAWKVAREVVAMVSALIPRSLVNYSVSYEVI